MGFEVHALRPWEPCGSLVDLKVGTGSSLGVWCGFVLVTCEALSRFDLLSV